MEDIATELVNIIMKLMLAGFMMFVIFLPFLMIPYVFMKMGGVASTISGMVGKGFKRAGKTAMKSKTVRGGMESKMGEWAGKGGLRGRVGGFKAQQEFKRNRRADIAARRQHGAAMERLNDDGFVRSIVGKDPNGVETARLRAGAIAAEREESFKRRDSKKAEWNHNQTSRDDVYQEGIRAVERGDTDTANAAFEHLSSAYGSFGRKRLDDFGRDASAILNAQAQEGPEQAQVAADMARSLSDTLSTRAYGSLSSTRPDLAKGRGFTNKKLDKDGNEVVSEYHFDIKPVSELAAPQLATAESSTFANGAPSPTEARIVLDNPALMSQITDTSTRAKIVEAAGAGTGQPHEVNINVQSIPGASGAWEQHDTGLVIPKDSATRPRPPRE